MEITPSGGSILDGRQQRALAARSDVPDVERLWRALSLEERAYVGLLLQEVRGESVLYGPRRIAYELFAVTRVTDWMEDKTMNTKATHDEQNFWPSRAHRNGNSRLSGSKLISWLRDKALAKGDTSDALAAQLDLTVDELADFVTGTRAIASASDEFISRCAAYLCVPRIAVMIAAEQVVIGDFMFPADYSNDAAEVAIRAVAGDPLLGSLMPESVHRLPVDVKRFIALLFQEATGQEVFSRHRHLPMVLQDAQLAALAVDEVRAKANAFN